MAKVYLQNKAFIGSDGRSKATKKIKAAAPGLKKSQYSAITKELRKYAGGGVTGSEIAKALSEVAGQGVIRRGQALNVKNKLGVVGLRMGYSSKSDTQPEKSKTIQGESPAKLIIERFQKKEQQGTRQALPGKDELARAANSSVRRLEPIEDEKEKSKTPKIYNQAEKAASYFKDRGKNNRGEKVINIGGNTILGAIDVNKKNNVLGSLNETKKSLGGLKNYSRGGAWAPPPPSPRGFSNN